MNQPVIHLVFKTHLDIGFTDHAARVRRQYHDQFIPQAISTGEHFYAENPGEPAFIWTTGAWLIWDHLNSQDAARVRRLEQAIERGLIAWHALPYTTHTELMSPALFRAGISYGAELDQRFGKTTIAAKMTDVPGHTLGVVPLLAEAGIRFLHLGVNTASPVPDVPPIFRWRAPDGSEVVVMYQASYGETDFPAGSDIGLSFAHTNDNIGPQSVGQTVEALRHLQHAHPGALIKPSTLDAFGQLMWDRREQFPVVTQEIGDSWIHGAGSDPQKLSRFKALQRLYDSFDDVTPARLAFGRGLGMVAEHTWGVDIKTYLRDDKAWDRSDFEAARSADFRLAFAEQSWSEQRAYIDEAIQHLEPADRGRADAATRALSPDAPGQTTLADGGWVAEIAPNTGDIAALIAPDGRRIAGSNGSLIGYRYETYDSAELQRHLDSYLQHRIEWAILDHDKPGLANAKSAATRNFVPRHAQDGWSHLPDEAHTVFGAPQRHGFSLQAVDADTVEIRLTLLDKPANRMPEAGFVTMTPAGASDWALKKLGLWHDPANMARRGGGQLQAVEAVRCQTAPGHLGIEPLDTPLVGAAGAPFMPFQPELPDYSSGIRFNIHNNKWGTNFPMWWEGDMLVRLIVRLEPRR